MRRLAGWSGRLSNSLPRADAGGRGGVRGRGEVSGVIPAMGSGFRVADHHAFGARFLKNRESQLPRSPFGGCASGLIARNLWRTPTKASRSPEEAVAVTLSSR